MKPKSNLLVPALIIVAIYCLNAESAAPLVNDIGLPRRDLSLLQQRTKSQGATASTRPLLGFPLIHPAFVTFDISEAMVATNRQVLKISIAGQRPVICELRSPCRIVVKPTNADQRINLSDLNLSGSATFSGGVRIEVFVREQLILELTGDEVTVER